jgi:hypothetical protein
LEKRLEAISLHCLIMLKVVTWEKDLISVSHLLRLIRLETINLKMNICPMN